MYAIRVIDKILVVLYPPAPSVCDIPALCCKNNFTAMHPA